MTVASEENKSGPYIGNGVTTVFAYEFRILDAAHIRVVRTQALIDAVLVLGIDYGVSGVGEAGGGSITTVTAPAANQTITILRDVPFTQETDLENQGPYYAETIEEALDLAVMRDQQLSERLDVAMIPADAVAAGVAAQAAAIAAATAAASAVVARIAAEAARDGALAGNYFSPQGRGTLTSLTPVMGTNVIATNRYYYTPYGGDMVQIYNGSSMVPTAFPEVSQLTTDTTKAPAACVANSNYDVYGWVDAGVRRLSRSPPWASDNVRSAGAATVMVQGVLLNAVDIPNGPAAQRGTYLFSIRTNASATIDFIFGGSSASGQAASFGIWNVYNRIPIGTRVGATSDWGYNVANTWRKAGGGGINLTVSAMRGLDEDGVAASYRASATTGAGSIVAVGIGLNSTTTIADACTNDMLFNSDFNRCGADFSGSMGLGWNTLYALEVQNNTAQTVWYSTATMPFLRTCGLNASVWL